MRFVIRHNTHYRYSRAVRLNTQQLRFHPRDDGAEHVIEHYLLVRPTPAGRYDYVDLKGNRVTEVWFDQDTDHFDIEVTMRVETLRRKLDDFLLAPDAVILPLQHGDDDFLEHAYLQRTRPDDSVDGFAAELARAANQHTLDFLANLNRALFSDFSHIHRDTGEPHSPAHTLRHKRGACRDLAVLFVDCCRTMGLPTRFVSGYQKGDLESERRHLHAWPEVYLPGGGWRGYDPTHGTPIIDTHVPIAAAALARDTMPVTGTFSGQEATSQLDFDLSIDIE